LENATSIAQVSYRQEVDRIGRETETMATDLTDYLAQVPIDSDQVAGGFARQVYLRNLSEAVILDVAKDGSIHALALVNPYDRQLDGVVTRDVLARLASGPSTVPIESSDRIGAGTRLPIGNATYVYAARKTEAKNT